MDLKVFSIEGNRQSLDGGSMFGNVPKALWEKWHPSDAQGRIELACRTFVVTDGSTTVLCETGIGGYMDPKMAQRFGVKDPNRHCLLENLSKIGILPEDIDYIILSHLHFDHAGGLLFTHEQVSQGQIQGLVFPKAKIIVGQDAWQRAIQPHPRDRASFIANLPQFLIESDRLILVPKEASHLECLWPSALHFHLSYGHTPGMLLAGFSGSEYYGIFCGDLVPGSAWVHIPITMGYDRFAEKVIDEKTELYTGLCQSPLKPLLFFTHDPKISGGTLIQDEKNNFKLSQEFVEFDGVVL